MIVRSSVQNPGVVPLFVQWANRKIAERRSRGFLAGRQRALSALAGDLIVVENSCDCMRRDYAEGLTQTGDEKLAVAVVNTAIPALGIVGGPRRSRQRVQAPDRFVLDEWWPLVLEQNYARQGPLDPTLELDMGRVRCRLHRLPVERGGVNLAAPSANRPFAGPKSPFVDSGLCV